jgi:hypothetical protein
MTMNWLEESAFFRILNQKPKFILYSCFFPVGLAYRVPVGLAYRVPVGLAYRVE